MAKPAAMATRQMLNWLNRLGNRTTAFNLAAVIGVVVAFVVTNVQEALGGRWDLGPSPDLGSEELRKMIGLFAIVQGFEASRYIGVRFAAERRVSTCASPRPSRPSSSSCSWSPCCWPSSRPRRVSRRTDGPSSRSPSWSGRRFRVFAGYFTVQAALAGILAARKQNWWAVAGFVGVALMMLTILVFGLPL